MVLFNFIIRFTCVFVYYFMKFKKTKNNKITFISRLSNQKTLDFKLIENQLRKRNSNIECVFLCRKIDSFTDGFFKNIIYTLKCLSNLADSKVCVTDSYTIAVSSVSHKKSLCIIQIWHSMGAIKKFGYQSLGNVSGRDSKTAKILNIHANYNYIISGSKEMTKYFSKAFNYSKDRFLNYGLPRIDYLLDNEQILKTKIFKKYPSLKKKINVLYAPTFRTTKDDMTSELIKSIDSDKFNLVIKGHANQKLNFNDKKTFLCEEFSALEMLCACDYLITDYSAIAIEAAILDKKTLYYVYDYEKYKENNGLNINLFNEMPECVFRDAKELCAKLNREDYDMEKLQKYKNKYIDVQDGSSTAKICNLIKINLEGVVNNEEKN